MCAIQLHAHADNVAFLARAQKVAEWKDRKEAILRGEITALEEVTDAGIDSIYDVQEEVCCNIYCVVENDFLEHCLCQS